jgi:hypothetical protein
MRIGLTVIALMTVAVVCISRPTSGQILPTGARCLHDSGETQAERTRREQALAVARAINTAEGQALQQTGRYQPLASLPNVPTLPNGFTARLFADGEGYVFSVKDTRDLCRYGIFSDQSGTLYSLTPAVSQMAQR